MKYSLFFPIIFAFIFSSCSDFSGNEDAVEASLKPAPVTKTTTAPIATTATTATAVVVDAVAVAVPLPVSVFKTKKKPIEFFHEALDNTSPSPIIRIHQ